MLIANALTAITLAGVSITGNYPGVEVVGLEEDHPAVVAALESQTPGVCTDAIGTTVTDEARGFVNFPAELMLDGNCQPLPGNEWLEIY